MRILSQPPMRIGRFAILHRTEDGSRCLAQQGLDRITAITSQTRRVRCVLRTALLMYGLFASPYLGAQRTAPLVIDAATPFVSPGPAAYRAGASVSPTGMKIGMNSRYLTISGVPWLPVMGEFQFSRYPESQWEEEILKMKAAGVQIVGTYIFWIHHEELEGQFDWTGQRDLRRFVQLCAKHGLFVYPRIGPWAHGEARNGGFPDWLLKKGKVRSADPEYMSYVAKFYEQIGKQLQGLMWKDGGPVIGIQIENEYASPNKAAGEEYILALKKLAIKDGMDVPLYTVTGWNRAIAPEQEVVPVFGGYPDAPWDKSLTDLPPSDMYEIVANRHHSGDMGMIGAGTATTAASQASAGTPSMTVEMGGGVQDTYHRRPALSTDDVAAMVPVAIGSGVNVYGTYVFQGGENPDGKLSTLQESKATGYATDVPVKSYDFQAPLSEFGEERETFRRLKLFNYFLNDFGYDLAPMIPHAAAMSPKAPDDLGPLRASVRTKDDRGYIFVNNYVRGALMPARNSVQFEIHLPGRTMIVPETPLDVPSGSYFVWPLNLNVAGTILRYSTAQLLTKLDASNVPTYLFFCVPGVRCDFSFAQEAGLSITATGLVPTERNGAFYLTDVKPNTNIILKREGRTDVKVMVLSQERAEEAWKLQIDGHPSILFTKQQYFASAKQAFLQSNGNPNFEFEIYPSPKSAVSALPQLHRAELPDNVASFSSRAQEQHVELKEESVHQAGDIPPDLSEVAGKTSRGIQAPQDADFDRAAVWHLALSSDAMKGLSDVILQFNYVGDVARLTNDSRLLADDFYNGRPWKVGMRRFLERKEVSDLQLKILPLRSDAPIFLEDNVRASLHTDTQSVELNEVRVILQYQLTIDLSNR